MKMLNWISEMTGEDLKCIHLAQERVQCQVLVNTVINRNNKGFLDFMIDS
jgi:hypothetical protein